MNIPSGYIQLPLWLLVILITVLTAFISYVWARLEGRIKFIEEERDDLLKKRTENPVLTMTVHERVCEGVISGITKRLEDCISNVTTLLTQRVDHLEADIGLLIENAILKATKIGSKKHVKK